MSSYPDGSANPNDPPAAKSETEARQGETSGKMRYVLGVSTGLAVIALIVVYFVVLT